MENVANTDWEKAIHYHDVKKRIHNVQQRKKLRASAIRAIVHKALATMGSISRPYQLVSAPWTAHASGDLDLDLSFEEDPRLENLQIERKENRRAEVIVCLDTSLSMTGKKLAINAVALAVLALQLEPEDLSIIAFESDAALIKPILENRSVYQILEKFMEVPARGLTNIEAGLKMAAMQAIKGRLAKKAVILMTDGRFTAGANPESIVPKLPKLHVIQTGNPWASPRFCRNLARLGNGKYVRVSQTEQLPKALYSLVHEIIR